MENQLTLEQIELILTLVEDELLLEDQLSVIRRSDVEIAKSAKYKEDLELLRNDIAQMEARIIMEIMR